LIFLRISKVDLTRETHMVSMECHRHHQRKLPRTISIGHGEKAKIPVENCIILNPADMSLSMIIAEDLCEMMHDLINLQSSSDLHRMGPQSLPPPFKHIVLVDKMELMAVVGLRPMSVEGVEILSEE
jgi:hypothetical protein